MGKKRLQCLFVGPKSDLYVDLLDLLSELNLNVQVKQANLKSTHIAYSLKKCRDACLVIISDRVNFSLGELSDLVWRHSSDAIIVIITNQTVTTSLKKPFNTTQISKLFLEKKSDESSLFLQYLVQYAQLKADFRRCKRLLGISEKRAQWMLDSSRDAIAYVSRDIYLYANTSFLQLFDVEAIENLQRTPVQEFITKDEQGTYKSFIEQQLRSPNMKRSLVLSMRKANGLVFRANIYAVPALFKGQKCLQLWVHAVNNSLPQHDNEVVTDGVIKNKLESNKEGKSELKNKIEVTTSSILSEIIKRQEASISIQKLRLMKRGKSAGHPSLEHLLLSLKVKATQKSDINNLLTQTTDGQSKDEQIVFWDKVKLTRIIQILVKKKIDKLLYIALSASSLNNDKYMRWLAQGIEKVGTKSTSIVFLLPYQLSSVDSFNAIHQLKSLGCKIAFDNFRVSSEHLIALKRLTPDYIRLSSSWVNSIKGNDSREVALGDLVRQFESKKIKVIAPCGLSKDIERLFALSGASFCQEILIKPG